MICSICSAVRALEHEHARPGQERRVDLERRVLCRCADENHRPVLDVGQDHVLLGLVEAVNLVDEEDRAPSLHAEAVLGVPDDGAEIGDSRSYSAHGTEVALRGVGHQVGESRLAGARRAPEDDGGYAVGLDAAAEDSIGPDDVLLPDELVE